jgi:hypothetical protein
VVQYQTHTTETLNYLPDYFQEFHATKDIFTTYQTSKATDSIAHAHMTDLTMPLKAEHAIEDEKRAEHRETLSCAQRNTERQRTKSTYRKSTIQRYMNVPPSTSAKFTSCCIMRKQFSALDT